MIGAVSSVVGLMPSPVIVPGRASGKTTLEMVCHWVAPKAIDASWFAWGTARSKASSDDSMTKGRINAPNVNDQYDHRQRHAFG